MTQEEQDMDMVDYIIANEILKGGKPSKAERGCVIFLVAAIGIGLITLLIVL